MAVFLFSVLAGWPALGCGVACSEVKLSVQTHSSSESDSGRSTFCTVIGLDGHANALLDRAGSGHHLHVNTRPSITFASHNLMDDAVTPLEISLHICYVLFPVSF